MRGPPGAPAVRWLALAGPPPDAIAAALLGRPEAEAKLEPMARSAGCAGPESLRAVLASGEVLRVERHPARRRPGPLRALARLFGRDAARREWRALRRL